jgi:hypothetical protein
VTQVGFDFAPLPKRHIRQRETARAVYHAHVASEAQKSAAGRETREGQVLRCLVAFTDACHYAPTSLELLAFSKSRGENFFDPNSVRPRITKLVDIGIVESAGKRICAQSGKTVMCWRVRTR